MARKRSNSAAIFSQAASTAEAIHQQDQVAEQKAERDRAQRINLPLSKIQPRAEDTRPLKDSHVANLIESIGALGLIEPLVVDLKGVLLAGGHRLAAIQLLKATDPDLFYQHFPEDLVPVRAMSFDSEADPERSLQVELAENEKRVNYSRDQIERLAIRLRSLNYRDTPGRPKEGEKALGPALAVAIGVSTRYVRKVLRGSTNDARETRNSVPSFSRMKTLQKIEAALEELLNSPELDSATKADRELLKTIPAFLVKLKASLNEKRKQK
jgi:ParB family transcriptional regulator, chromosome partitioning protein